MLIELSIEWLNWNELKSNDQIEKNLQVRVIQLNFLGPSKFERVSEKGNLTGDKDR